MNSIICPNASLLFMKVGIHAREPLEEIIERKLQEIKDTGRSFWGYGGSTCHPTTMVQPFAAEQEALRNPIYLVMQKMNSNHWAEPVRADEFSVNGRDWEVELELPLARANVALGKSQGKSATDYISGRVDKACLTLDGNDLPLAPDEPRMQIGLVAKLESPYAVFLRNK